MPRKTLFPVMRWAVPSFVIPDTVAGNVRFLRGRVPEVALCFFETGGCLAYTDADLPAIGETADLRFHVHLPTGGSRAGGCRRFQERFLCFFPGRVSEAPPGHPSSARG